MVVSCEPNYVLQAHPLSLGGTIPLPPTCEPDGEKVKKIKAVADKAIEELRERRAVYECGNGVKGSTPGSSATSAEVRAVAQSGQAKLEIAEDELKREVGKQRRKGLTAEEFDELWQAAWGDIKQRDEVDVIRDGVTLPPSDLAESSSQAEASPASPSPAPSEDRFSNQFHSIESLLHF